VHGDGNEMVVTVTDPPAMNVLVGTGTVMVQGRFCENDAALTLAVTAAHATYPRIDRVVVRLNASPGRTIDIVVKPGTAAPEPAAPALTRTAETWELSLAQIRVEAGATSILSAKITDERGNSLLCGVAAPVYVPSSQLEVVGAVNMQSNALTGLPAPSGATDAARKGYVDTEIAGAIGGFGISQIAIDADKNWNGKSITGVNALECEDVKPTIVCSSAAPPESTTLFALVTTTTSATKTFAKIRGTGQLNVQMTAPVGETVSYDTTYTYRAFKNGVEVWSKTVNSGSSYNVPAVDETFVISVHSGDTFYITANAGATRPLTATGRAYLSLPLDEGLVI
jgi:hypothetical protein